MSGRSPHVMFNLGGIHACLGTHVSVDHMWRNMQLGCFADGKYCWYGYGYVGLEKYRLWVTSIQGQCSQWYLVGNTTILVSLMCISYIHTIPQFSFNTILLLHFKFTTIKHVYEQGCMENIHNRRFDGCEILEKQISACFYSQFKIWLPFDKLKQFARVCRSLAEKRHLLWTEHRSRDTARKKIRDKKGQGARTLKRGERTEYNPSVFTCGLFVQTAGNLMANCCSLLTT